MQCPRAPVSLRPSAVRSKATVPSITTVTTVTAWAVALIAALLAAAPARAQMLPFVPDPVTTSELVEHAEHLGLSDGQMLGVLDVHAAYREEYRALEEGPVRELIDELLGLARAFQMEGFRIPARSEFESVIDGFDAIINKANAIDRSLFDRIAVSLTEPQMARLPSVRMAREMTVYKQLMQQPAGELNPGAPIVLSAMVRELDLDDGERERTAETLRQYERIAVARTRKLHKLAKDAATAALDWLDASGLRQMTPMEMFELASDGDFEQNMRTTFNEESKPIQSELFAASQRNLRFLQQMMTLLEPDHAAALRDRYYRQAFRRVYRGPAEWRASYDAALRLVSLAGERGREVQALRDEYAGREDQLIDRAVLMVEASREYRTARQLDGDDDKRRERLETYREQRDAIGREAMASLQAMLTTDEYAKVTSDEPETEERAETTIVMSGGAGGSRSRARVVVEDDGGRRPGAVRGLPGPMTTERRDQLARLAALDDDQRAVLVAVYDDYRVDYDAALDEIAAAIEAANSAASEGDNDGGANDADGADPAVARLARLATIDDTMFESMELLLEGERVGPAARTGRALRARERATHVAQRSNFVFGREESYIDLVAVVMAMDDADDLLAQLPSLIEGYEHAVGTAVDARLAAIGELRRTRRVMERMRERGLGGRATEAMEGKVREQGSKMRSFDNRVRDENRRQLDALVATLDEDRGWALRLAYQRTAFPDVYDDELELDEVAESVRGLDDLTARQRDQVERAVADYRMQFARLSERMVELRQERDFDFTAMRMPSADAINGEVSLERLRFDRREAGAKAMLRMRLALTPTQIERAGLTKVPESSRRLFD